MLFRVFAVSLLFFIVSCHSNKTVTGTAEISAISPASLYKQNLSQSFQNSSIKTVKVDAKMYYKTQKSSQKLGLKMRIAKDEKIWISGDFLGIPIAKLLVEKDSVHFYNKFDKTYFKGSFEFLQQIIGSKVTYKTLEQLLMGDLILANRKFKNYDLEIKDNAYFLSESEPQDYAKTASIYPIIYKTKYQSIENSLKNNLFQVFYNSHQNIDNFLFPKKLEFQANNQGKSSVISMDYSKVYVNEDLSFPFQIPDSCDKQIILKPKN